MTQAFNLALLANKANTSGQLDASTGLFNAAPVSNGGTGLATITANSLMVGNGTGNVALIAPGSNGNTLISNGTSWVSSAAPYAGSKGQIFTSSGTFTIPPSVTAIKVTVVGGGGGGAGCTVAAACSVSLGGGGGGGSMAIQFFSGLTPGNTLSVTIGAAGTAGGVNAAGGAGGTSSVASGTQTITTVSCPGGGGGTPAIANSTGSPSNLGSGGSTPTGGTINLPGYPYKGWAGASIYAGAFYNQSGIAAFTLGSPSPLGGYPTTSAYWRSGGGGSVGDAASNYGSGGCGGLDAGNGARAGGAGAAGIVIIEW